MSKCQSSSALQKSSLHPRQDPDLQESAPGAKLNKPFHIHLDFISVTLSYPHALHYGQLTASCDLADGHLGRYISVHGPDRRRQRTQDYE